MSELKFKLKEYIEMLNESDEKFALQILTFIIIHLKRTGKF